MKAVLICPGERPTVSALAQTAPLALVPVLGKTLLEYWLDYLVDRGVRHIYLLVSDRPQQVQSWLGDGLRWELKVEVVPELYEPTPAEARAKYRGNETAGWLAGPDDVIVMDFLPSAPEHPLFRSYADWFRTIKDWLPQAASAPDRVGLRELKPGVWVGMHSRISPDAELRAPCWIGENVLIGVRAIIGPRTIVENGGVVGADSEIADSIVGAETYVGELTEVKNSLARGGTLINWQTGFCTHVPDSFLLCALSQHTTTTKAGHWLGRLMAAAVMLLTLPLGLFAVLKGWSRGQRALRPLVAVRPQSASSTSAVDALVYHEFTAVNGWMQRWPQLWKVARGEFAWVGNRPLSPAVAVMLSNDFERLWLKAPIGLFSLADAEACAEPFDQEARVHASFYAVRADWRLDMSILSRIFGLRQLRRTSFEDRL